MKKSRCRAVQAATISSLPWLGCIFAAAGLAGCQSGRAMMSLPDVPRSNLRTWPSDERLRSAALVRTMPQQASRPLSIRQERESLHRHFEAVIEILIANTDISLIQALDRLERASGQRWSLAQRQRQYQLLLDRRMQNIKFLVAYQGREIFPRNESDRSCPQPIFIDRHDIACAVGYLMRCSGLDAEVQAIALLGNHVYVPDVVEGALVSWVLQSGLTQEEAALIQPTYYIPPHPHTPWASLLSGDTLTQGPIRYENFELSANGTGRLPDPKLVYASAHPVYASTYLGEHGAQSNNSTNWLWLGGLQPFQFGQPDRDASISILFAYDAVAIDSQKMFDGFFLTTRSGGFENFYNHGNISMESEIIFNGQSLGTVFLDPENFAHGASSSLLFDDPKSRLRVETSVALTDPAKFSAIMHEFGLTAVPEILVGDANRDSTVTGADMISVEQNYGASGHQPLIGDANIDGLVTGRDLISVQYHYGAVTERASSGVIPEPAGAAIFILVVWILSMRMTRTSVRSVVPDTWRNL